MKIEIVSPENKLDLRARQVYKHFDGSLYLVVHVYDGYDLVNLNTGTRYAAQTGQGMAGGECVFEFVGWLKVTP